MRYNEFIHYLSNLSVIVLFGMVVLGFIIRYIIGSAVNGILRRKGYPDKNWFWFGFFFPVIAPISALLIHKNETYLKEKAEREREAAQKEAEKSKPVQTPPTTWKCECGRENYSYTGTCACGKSRFKKEAPTPEVIQTTSPTPIAVAAPISNTTPQSAPVKKEHKINLEEETRNIAALKKLKELFDSGALTQEEFEEKKKRFL